MRKKNILSIFQNILFLYFLPLPIIALSFIIYSFFSNLTILPSRNTHLEFSTYDDRVEIGGRSTVNNQTTGVNLVSINFILRSGYAYPFAGCQFRVDSISHLINLKPYKWMILKFDSTSTISNVHIILKEDIKDFTTANPLSERFHTYDLVLKPGQTRYKIPINKFICPFWWYVQNSKSSEDLPDPTMGRTAGINFESGSLLALDKSYNLILTNVQFQKYPYLPIIIICITLLYYLVLSVLIFLRKKTSVVNHASFYFDHLNIPNQSTENMNSIIKYVGSHYTNMDLSVQTVSKETGIASDKITKIIKEHSDMTFRQYLNYIRISEAKRLLLESDRQILDIALAVGYNSVNHFNKVFKLLVSCSPKEFRK